MRRILFTVLLTLTLFSMTGLAQVTQTARGINGNMDANARSPQLSVTRVVTDAGVSLLADAFVPNKDYQIYPFRFDFYVNRKLYATQYRSTDLPGPVGVDIGPDVATIPFNYTVMATLIHPNKVFTTIISGAAYSNDFVATLDCDLTLNATTSDSTVFSASGIETSQSGDSDFVLSYSATDISTGDTVAVTGVINTNSSAGTASSSLSVTRDGNATVNGVSGTFTVADSKIASLELTSSDGNIILSCN